MDNLMIQLLPVAEDSGNLSEPPTSAEEYLRRVRVEAQACPEIAVASFKDRIPINKQTRVVSNSTGFIPAPRGFSPSVECQLNEAANFASLRQNLSQQREKYVNGTTDSHPALPKDESGWCRLCLGQELQQRLNCKRGISSGPVEHSVEPDILNGSLPLLSIVASMKQTTVTEVLEYQINWLQMLGLSPNQGRWLYALLACLQKPLEPDAHAMLRTLSRQCAALRASLESIEDERLPILNILITLVARYFDQSDLADNG